MKGSSLILEDYQKLYVILHIHSIDETLVIWINLALQEWDIYLEYLLGELCAKLKIRGSFTKQGR